MKKLQGIKALFPLLIIVLQLILPGCERDHFPASNEEKLEHQEDLKEKHDVPTNNDNDESEINDVENEPGEN